MVDLLDRIAEKIDFSGECWEWTAYTNRKGYGVVGIRGKKTGLAHKVLYEIVVEPIPAGLVSDHLCRNPRCVNPDHIEPVTNGENVRRGDHHMRRVTHCPSGHPYNDSNTRIKPSTGERQCRTCIRNYARSYYHRKKAQNKR